MQNRIKRSKSQVAAKWTEEVDGEKRVVTNRAYRRAAYRAK